MVIDRKNLLIRVAVAAVGIPLVLCLAMIGSLPFLVLVAVSALLGMLEFSKIAAGTQAKLPGVFLAAVIVASLCLIYYERWETLLAMHTVVFFALSVSFLRLPVEEAVRKLTFSVLGIVYLSLFAFWILIRQLPKHFSADYAFGGHWMISLFLLVWSCDTAAYFGGKFWGKHKLAPAISPGKTKEGAICGIIGAMLAAVLIKCLFFQSLRLADLLIVSLLVGLVGQIGDLFESLLKRSAQLKDTSTIIPGHGGVLDRFDSLMFVSPWVYLYLRWFVFRA